MLPCAIAVDDGKITVKGLTLFQLIGLIGGLTTFQMIILFSSSSESSSTIASTIELLREDGIVAELMSVLPSSSFLSSTDMPEQRNRTLTPRSWKPWTDFSDLDRPSFRCFNPEGKIPFRSKHEIFPLREKAFYTKGAFASDVTPTRGLLFIKPMKVGGSTATGVNIRVSKNEAKRQNKTFPICENSYDHAKGQYFRHRNIWDSFLWTMLRDPTDRAVSYFFHYAVSRKGVAANSANLESTLTTLYHYYLRTHTLRDLDYYKKSVGSSKRNRREKELNVKNPNSKSNQPYFTFDSFKSAAQDIIRDYKFIGIQERFDESLVVLKYLIGVPLGDMLYVPSKINGSHDEQCNYIQPSVLTQKMQDYLNGTAWERRSWWDRALYDAANQSLDLTIDSIGREKVQSTLEKFRTAQEIVKKRCTPLAKPPCATDKHHREPEETNCLFLDSGCAFECLDEVSKELGIDRD